MIRTILTAVCVFSFVCALILWARESASWEPRKIAELPYRGKTVISADDRLMVNWSDDERGLVAVRDIATGRNIATRAIGHRIFCVAFSPDGNSLAIAWTAYKSRQSELIARRTHVSLLNFHGKYRELEAGREYFVLDWPRQIRFSPDGKTLWLASTDNLRAWDVLSGKLRWQWRKSDLGRGSSLPYFSALSKDCRWNFRSDENGYSVLNTHSGKPILQSKLPYLADSELEFSGDAALAAYQAMTPRGDFNTVVETRTGRVLWEEKSDWYLLLVGDKTIRQTARAFETLDARSGKQLRTLPSVAKAELVPSGSGRWLFTIRDKTALYRQRLQ